MSIRLCLVVLALAWLLSSCSTAAYREVTLEALKLNRNYLVLMAHVRTNDATGVALPRFSHSSVDDVVNTTIGDTLSVTFTNGGGRWNVLSPPAYKWEEGDKSGIRLIRNGRSVGIALIEGDNTNTNFVRMRLYGVEKDIILPIGQQLQVYPDSFPIREEFFGGYAK
jgi:hypothetical protein